MIFWERPGYVVAFTTRVGGVSEGVYESLNLTAKTGDDPERVEENRRRACDAAGLAYSRLSFNRQVHETTVHRAGGRGAPGDGLGSEEPGEPMLTFAADCLPIAIARTDGTRRLALVHAGWRGLSAGIVQAGVQAVGAEAAAIVGPSIGPCCYEVGDEVSARFDPDLTVGRHLDLWSAAERALRGAGVAAVERVDLCTACNPELFFSHRRSGEERGVQGLIGAVA
jgi:YfiH family protein